MTVTDEKWALIYTTKNDAQSEMIIHSLKNEGIEAVKMNKQDSSYMIGDIEIYVKLDDLCAAKNMIKEFEK